MALTAQIEKKGDINVVRASGKITIGEGEVYLRDTIQKLSSAGAAKILLDLGNVSFVDSSGLGALIGSYSSVVKGGGELKLLNLTKKIHDLLQVTRLYVVFDVFSDESEAIASFANPSTKS